MENLPRHLCVSYPGGRRAMRRSALSVLAALTVTAGLSLQPSHAAFVQSYETTTIGSKGDFGYSVDIDGQRVVITSPFGFDENSNDADDGNNGAVHIYDARSGSELRTIIPPDRAAIDGAIESVSISGDRIAVGAPSIDGGGEVYMYSANNGNLISTIENAAAPSSFGASVAVNGNRLLVGAGDSGLLSIEPDGGGAFLYDADSGGLISELTVDSGPTPLGFGTAVDLNDDFAVVGATRESTQGNSSAGAAYIFDSDTGEQLQRLESSTPRDNELFGASVALSGNLVVVGAPGNPGALGGAAYVFDATTGEELQRLSIAGNVFNFGMSVAISGNMVAVKSPFDGNLGSTYVFDAISGELLQRVDTPDFLRFTNTGSESVALTNDHLVVGSPAANIGQGVVYTLQDDNPGTVPIPATFGLIGLGGLLMAARRRREVQDA